MLQNLFSWLRASIRDSVLAGVADALEIIEGEPASDMTPALTQLRARLAATPALTHDEGKKGKKVTS